MTGFTDIHSHFIYGVDDGAKTRADMEAMLDAAHADGITSLFATSHMTPGLQPFDDYTYRSRLEEAQSYCQNRGYGMTLYSGAEVLYTPALQNYVSDHSLPTLANSKDVLMEFVPDVSLREMESALDLLEWCGYAVVLAHVERYACLFQSNCINRIKEQYNVRYQVNANTVLSEHAFFRSRCIRNWFHRELIDFVASDAHDVRNRTFQLQKAYNSIKSLYGANYAKHLVGIL